MTTLSDKYSHLSPLKQALLAVEEMEAKVETLERARKEPIAVVGMSCRFPSGGNAPESFWQLLREGRDAVSEVPSSRWNMDRYYDPDPDAPGKMCTRWGGFLDQVDQFDPLLFGIAPREAVSMDPQQRLLLEVSWEALERAGQSPERLVGSRSGVFIGITTSDYGQILARNVDLSRVDAYFASGIAHSVASGRLSYLLGLQGPSLSIDTACSSSLVAVHQACQSLRLGECRMALAGGVNVILLPDHAITFSKSRMMAADGRCKTFDARADGFVRAEGCGVVVLKRLSDAVTDGDNILALIRASAINQDGASSGLTAPNGPAQEALISEALTQANIAPSEVGYVEAHGTGTSLGDPIEVRALGAVFREGRNTDQPLLVGSVKTNLGHLEAAAGIAGLIKVVLSLQHGEIPPHLHLTQPNPHIAWEELPIAIPTKLQSWPAVSGRRIAGVSSFGFSGTNAHIVLEEAPAVEREEDRGEAGKLKAERPLHLLTLSAKSEEALKELAGRYQEHLGMHAEERLVDVCYTANTGRAHFGHRLAVLGGNAEVVREQLSEAAAGKKAGISGQMSGTDRPRVAFLFTGQGSQYVGMGKQLYETEPFFRKTMERCDELVRPYLEKPLLEVLYGGEGGLLDQTGYTQVALFALGYGLAELWKRWGIEPSVVMGHSVGEYVAACVAGLFGLEDGLKLIATRGRLMQALPAGGQMVAVFSDEGRVRQAIGGYAQSVSIAAINGPENVVISGAGEAVQEVVQRLEGEKVKTQRLVVSHAFHSPLMEPMLGEFERVAGELSYQTPRVGLVSNVTGEMWEWRQGEASQGQSAYWRRHVREAVQFEKGMGTLAAQNCQVYLEIGPSPVLLGMGKRCLREAKGEWLPSLRKGREDWQQMLDSLGRLYVEGARVDWVGFDRDYPRRKVSLPTYPFQRQRYWIEATEPTAVPVTPHSATSNQHPLPGRRIESPAFQGTIFETRLGHGAAAEYAYDHRVFSVPILPGTAYMEMALAAAAEIFGAHELVLEDLVLHEALPLPEDGYREVQIILAPPEDGNCRFQLFSCLAPSRAWKLHAMGMIRKSDTDPKAGPVNSLRSAQDRCQQPLTCDEFYAGLRQRGLEFGPLFCGVEALWRGEAEALGKVRLDESLASEVRDYHIHPVLLDACVQVVAAAVPGNRDAVYLPMHLERYRLNGPIGFTELWGHARLRSNTSAETMTADLCVFDNAGRLVAELEGIHLKRADRKTLAGVRGDKYASWLYEVQWQAKPLVQAEAVVAPWNTTPSEIAGLVRPEIIPLSQEQGWEQYSELEPQLDALCSAYVTRALRQLGLPLRPGERIAAASLASRLKVKPQFKRLLGRMFDILTEDGVLRRKNGEWEILSVPERGDPEKQARKLMEHYPAFEAELTFTRRCGQQLSEALCGDCDPLQLLFPGGDASTAEKLYCDSPSAHVYNRIAQRAVEAALASLPAGRRLRILEIGGGTGSTSSYVLPELPADRTEYLFTDISPLFTARATERFSKYGFVRTQPLDIEQEPARQGICGLFDLIIAANVLHATRDLSQTFGHVRGLLSPGGLLVMLEVTSQQRWIDLTFGLTDDWWCFSDTSLRPRSPLLTRPEWHEFLLNQGFLDPVMLPDAETSSRALGLNAVILSQTRRTKEDTKAVHTESPKKWLILAGESALGQRLAEHLRARGHRALLAHPGPVFQHLNDQRWLLNPGNSEDVAQLVRQASADGALHGVVHLCAPDHRPAEEVGLAELQVAEQQVCGSALHLVQALLKAELPGLPSLWFVTRGGQALEQQATAPLQAMLWGFGKALALEHPELNGVLIDLDPSDAVCNLDPLLAEFVSSDGEDQVVYRDQVRYVARLKPSSRTQPPPGGLPIPDSEAFRLEIAERGVLDNLSLMPVARRVPSPGEVEIHVQATGLNFRDVLNALNMYPGDPGPVGSECSGRVVAVGPGVDLLHVGDPVIAIALGCFSSHATTQAELVVPKPDSLTFEEAVTIPNAFLTAYWALHHLGRMKSGERVLIHAAAGGVGLAAVQLALQAGAEIFATAGSPEKRAYLQSLGVHHVLNSRTLNFADEVLNITGGRGVDLVLNSLTGDFISKSLSLLAPGGRFLEIGRTGIWTDAQVQDVKPGAIYHLINLSEDYMQTPGLIRSMLLDLLENFKAGRLKPLPLRVFPLTEAIGAFRHMAQARHIGKLVLSQPWRQEVSKHLVRADSSYWITGGLGGLGLKVAEWLVESGARSLVLMSRSAPEAASQAVLKKLEERGARLLLFQGDVSCEEDVAKVLQNMEANQLPPLRGLIHSAGVVEDGGVLQQNWKRYRRVLAPKVDGGWLLHRATQHLDLDFFVLFSSAASLLGSAGQTNHSAANAYLDALAYYRQSQGLPAVSINWGAWSEVGAAVGRGITERIKAQGIETIAPHQGIEITEELARRGRPQVGVLPADWPVYLSHLPQDSLRFFAQLVEESRPVAKVKTTESRQPALLQRLEDAPLSKRRGLLQAEIREQSVKVLGLSPLQPIDLKAPLNGLGLDSLMAVELRNALGVSIGRTLPATLLFDYPTIEALTGYLSGQLAMKLSEKPEPIAVEPGDVLNRIEQLSDDELDRLLAEKTRKA